MADTLRPLSRLADALRLDIGFALRTLRRAPGFASAIIATLALGIGANAAMFSLADRMFLRPPTGVTDPSFVRRLYVHSNWSVGGVWEIRATMGYPQFAALDSGLASRIKLAAYSKPDTMALWFGNAVTMVHGSYATATYLQILGVRPALGRFYSADEDQMGAGTPVAVISSALWRGRFGGDSAVLGKEIDIARLRYRIIGVAQPGFAGADLNATDIWLPLATYPAPPLRNKPWFYSWRSGNLLRVIGRVAPNTPDAWLSAAGTTIFRRGELANVTAGPDSSATVMPGPVLESLGPSIKPAPAVAIATRLFGVTGIVLLIACANVANLLLARALGRRREIAVRLALGISRRRLVGQLLTEGIVLSVIAGIAAIVVGAWAGDALRAAMLPDTRWADRTLDLRVALFTGAAALVTGIVAALAPALRASRPELTSALKTGTRDGGGYRSRLRTALIVVQVALSVVLLHGAGLFVRSLSSVHAIDLGYDTERLIYGTVNFVNPEGRYIERSPHLAALSAGLAEAASRIERVPGVERTALATSPPMGGYAMIGLFFPGGARTPALDNLDPALTVVTPSYFATTGIRLVRGRLFTEADRFSIAEPSQSAGGVPVIVNETLARTYWPSREAVGQCLVMFRPTMPCSPVIGVVTDAHVDEIVSQPAVALYLPLGTSTAGAFHNASHLIVRTAPEHAARVSDEMRRELRRIFPQAERPLVRSTAQMLEPQVRPWRLGASLFSAFGVLALLVAAVGVYSVIAYAVSQRAHEMSVRVALGATALNIGRLVAGEGLAVIGAGVALGIGVALALGRLVASMLYATSTADPVVMAIVSLLLGVVALLATAVPAWRAMRADPVTALRAE